MQLSTRGRYAVMAMADLARREADHPDSRPVALAEIAAAQHLSPPYLEQLFCRLRRAGLLRASRGPGGGYRLARPVASVSIADIVLAAEEDLRTTLCHAAPGCPAAAPGAPCLTHDLWDALGTCIRGFLAQVTLDDVIRGRLAPAALRVAAE
jgi:Rrf2 family iron-sulfur cluster assembly transcriptional regulator